ncbi:MAG: class I SAM-dependent methyltransferase [Eubacteriales bacterium]
MDKQMNMSALITAFFRAWHYENTENPIFSDEKVRNLITDEEYRAISDTVQDCIGFISPEKKDSSSNCEVARPLFTQIVPTYLAGDAFCEDALTRAVRTGTEQYVIVGAGLNTFAFRNPDFLNKYPVYEVDGAAMQENKIRRIGRAGWKIPDKLRFVPTDFTKDGLGTELLKAGHDSKKKTLFSWFGAVMFLYRDEIEKILDRIASIAADGSDLLFDYADAGLFLSDEKWVRNTLDISKAYGMEIKSGFDPLSMELMLSDHGFLVYDHVSGGEIRNRYFAGRTDELSAFEHIGFVHAVLKK